MAQLKRVIGSAPGAQTLTAAACDKLEVGEARYLGIDDARLVAEALRCLLEDVNEFPNIIQYLST